MLVLARCLCQHVDLTIPYGWTWDRQRCCFFLQKYEVLGPREHGGCRRRRGGGAGSVAVLLLYLLLSSTVKECPASKQAVSNDSTSRRPVGRSASQSASQRDAAMRDKARGEPLITSLLGPDKDGRAEVSFSSYFKQGGWHVDGVPPVPERRHQHPAPCIFPAQPVGNKGISARH